MNACIEFSKAEYARPTKAELAHCTTSARSSKYAQSQKLSSLTSQKYRIFPQNKAVAILAQMQAGRPALIQKDGGEMLIAIVLDIFFSVQRRMASARSFNMFPSMLHMRLIN